MAADLSGKINVAPGIALVGDAKYANIRGRNVRLSGGSIGNTAIDLVTGTGGLSFDLGRDSEFRLEASEGNNVTGSRATLFSGTSTGFAYIKPNITPPISTRRRPSTIAPTRTVRL